MKNAFHIEQIERLWPDWDPSYVSFVTSFLIKAVDEDVFLNEIKMNALCQSRHTGIGWPDMANSFVPVQFLFREVSSLKMEFGSFPIQVMGIDAFFLDGYDASIGNIKVVSLDSDSFSFYCKRAEVVSIDKPVKPFLV